MKVVNLQTSNDVSYLLSGNTEGLINLGKLTDGDKTICIAYRDKVIEVNTSIVKDSDKPFIPFGIYDLEKDSDEEQVIELSVYENVPDIYLLDMDKLILYVYAYTKEDGKARISEYELKPLDSHISVLIPTDEFFKIRQDVIYILYKEDMDKLFKTETTRDLVFSYLKERKHIINDVEHRKAEEFNSWPIEQRVNMIPLSIPQDLSRFTSWPMISCAYDDLNNRAIVYATRRFEEDGKVYAVFTLYETNTNDVVTWLFDQAMTDEGEVAFDLDINQPILITSANRDNIKYSAASITYENRSILFLGVHRDNTRYIAHLSHRQIENVTVTLCKTRLELRQNTAYIDLQRSIQTAGDTDFVI